MSDYDLTDVDDVGPARADTIATAGFETVSDVTDADLDEFVAETGISETTAEGIIESASELIDADDEEDVDASEDEVVEETDVVENELPSWISMDPDDYIGVTNASGTDVIVPIQMDTRILMHVIHVVLEEATKKHQSSSFDNRNDAYRLSRKLMGLTMDAGDTIDETLLLDKNELRSLYRAVRQGSSDYASRRGIPNMWGTLESFKAVVDDLR